MNDGEGGCGILFFQVHLLSRTKENDTFANSPTKQKIRKIIAHFRACNVYILQDGFRVALAGASPLFERRKGQCQTPRRGGIRGSSHSSYTPLSDHGICIWRAMRVPQKASLSEVKSHNVKQQILVPAVQTFSRAKYYVFFVLYLLYIHVSLPLATRVSHRCRSTRCH